MHKFIIAALLAGTTATPALAQDAPVNAAGTGPRIEALIGYDAPDGFENNLVYGVGAGFDFTLGGATAGIEAEYTESESEEVEQNVFVSGDEVRGGLGRDLYVGGRLGFQVGESSFLYAKAGYTNLRVRAEYTDPNGDDTDDGQNLDGVRVGAGVEFGIPILNLGSSTYLKAEYRYSNYEQGAERHQGLAGIGFRF